jgi:hypothetical protein
MLINASQREWFLVVRDTHNILFRNTMVTGTVASIRFTTIPLAMAEMKLTVK